MIANVKDSARSILHATRPHKEVGSLCLSFGSRQGGMSRIIQENKKQKPRKGLLLIYGVPNKKFRTLTNYLYLIKNPIICQPPNPQSLKSLPSEALNQEEFLRPPSLSQ